MSKAGNVTVHYLSRLRHIGLGRSHAGEPVRILIAADYVRVVRADGSLLRELIFDAARDYLLSSTISWTGVHDVPREDMVGARGVEPPSPTLASVQEGSIAPSSALIAGLYELDDRPRHGVLTRLSPGRCGKGCQAERLRRDPHATHGQARGTSIRRIPRRPRHGGHDT